MERQPQNTTPKQAGAPAKSPARKEREALALRANLIRRKEQARARVSTQPDQPTAPETDAPHR
jgi:hypothetical protein